LHWLLFGLTVITTTWAGAGHQGVDLVQEPGRFTVGLAYSVGLLLILGVHELGHFFVARRHAINVTPPYFIPVPFGLGTFGAFIQMRSPPANRKALFDVAVAMFGSRVGNTISSVAMWSLFLLALFVWPGLMMWALIVFFIAGREKV
jgi:peptidase M50-like protein